jgi:hypothetical protein
MEIPPYVAVMVAVTLLETADVGTVKVPLVAPGATETLAGTVAEPVLPERATVAPAGGAGATVTVHVLTLPPTTVEGLQVNAVRLGTAVPARIVITPPFPVEDSPLPDGVTP